MSLQPNLVGLDDYPFSDRIRIVHALARFRREWESKADETSLVKVEASIGLLLSDIVDCLELTPQERHVLLGGKLIKEIDTFMGQRISLKSQ